MGRECGGPFAAGNVVRHLALHSVAVQRGCLVGSERIVIDLRAQGEVKSLCDEL